MHILKKRTSQQIYTEMTICTTWKMHGTSLKHQKSVIMCSWLSSAHHYRKSRFCRVRQGLPSANSLAHDKHKFCRVYSRKHTTKSKHTAKSCFAMCFFVTHGKVSFLWHTAKLNFAVCFILAHGKVINFFLSSHLETFSTLHIQHVVLHVKIWYIFVFICYI